MAAVRAGRVGGHRGYGDVDGGTAVRAVGRDVPEAPDGGGAEQYDLGMMGRVEPDPHALADFKAAPPDVWKRSSMPDRPARRMRPWSAIRIHSTVERSTTKSCSTP